MTQIRYFVPKGADPEHAKLQYLKLVPGHGAGVWTELPVVYEDPDDEVVPCPRLHYHNRNPDLLCNTCLGNDWVRKGSVKDLLRVMEELRPQELPSIARKG